MKKFSTRGRGSLYALMAFFCLMPAAVYAGFSFTRPELPLDADGHESIPQWGTHVAFDNAGGLHAVWSDDRNSPLGPHVYGTVIQSNGSVLIPYRAYHGTDSYAYNEAFITRNMNFTDKMYVFATENRLGPNLYAGISHWNLNDLPAEPAVVDLTETMLQSSMFASREDMDVIAYG